jgi:transposase
VAAPAVCYYYSPDRKGARPKEHLENYQGVLHADAYGGYDKLYPTKDNPASKISEAACWAHTRRKFYEVTVASNNANIAINALEQISDIYKIEAQIKGLDPDQRLKMRQEKSKILVEEFFSSIKEALDKLPQKGSTAKAIGYAIRNEEALMRFLKDGKIEIDNNAAERSMRSIALGRKNWMFAGSDNGGSTAATFYSIIETAKLNNVNPWLYLSKVLDVIGDYNCKKLADLLPWNIKL